PRATLARPPPGREYASRGHRDREAPATPPGTALPEWGHPPRATARAAETHRSRVGPDRHAAPHARRLGGDGADVRRATRRAIRLRHRRPVRAVRDRHARLPAGPTRRRRLQTGDDAQPARLPAPPLGAASPGAAGGPGPAP